MLFEDTSRLDSHGFTAHFQPPKAANDKLLAASEEPLWTSRQIRRHILSEVQFTAWFTWFKGPFPTLKDTLLATVSSKNLSPPHKPRAAV